MEVLIAHEGIRAGRYPLLTADGEQTHMTLTHRDLSAEEHETQEHGWTQLVQALRTAATR